MSAPSVNYSDVQKFVNILGVATLKKYQNLGKLLHISVTVTVVAALSRAPNFREAISPICHASTRRCLRALMDELTGLTLLLPSVP